MLLTKMDLLNYQYLDKMNNNIGILCYEGKPEFFCGRHTVVKKKKNTVTPSEFFIFFFLFFFIK